MEQQFNVCDKARVKQYDSKTSFGFSECGKYNRARIMPGIVGRIVVVVDYSDGHGLTYCVVAPNFDGFRGRDRELEFVWVDPSELEPVEPNVNPR